MSDKKNSSDYTSLLVTNHIQIIPGLILNIPTVGEVLKDEKTYFGLVSALTSVPYQYMVQLDDIGIDFTTITDYDLFLMLFPIYTKGDTSLLFGELDMSDFDVYINHQNNKKVLFSPKNDLTIDESTYLSLAAWVRKINLLKRLNTKSGNDANTKYQIEKNRRKQKRRARKKYESEFEKLVVALVNQKDFKYNYESIMDLSIYKFYQSFKQVQTNINFENTMRGIYAGTLDSTKLKDKSCLTWIPAK